MLVRPVASIRPMQILRIAGKQVHKELGRDYCAVALAFTLLEEVYFRFRVVGS